MLIKYLRIKFAETAKFRSNLLAILLIIICSCLALLFIFSVIETNYQCKRMAMEKANADIERKPVRFYGQLSLEIINVKEFAEMENVTIESGMLNMHSAHFKMFIQHIAKKFVKPEMRVYLGYVFAPSSDHYYYSPYSYSHLNKFVNATATIWHISGEQKRNYEKTFVEHNFGALDFQKEADGMRYYIFGWDQFAMMEFLMDPANGFLGPDGALKVTMNVTMEDREFIGI